MLRDFDLSPQEESAIALTKEDLNEMAAPFAGFAVKNKVLRKHGREIIAATDSWEALVAISIWMRRVNRIAKRHRKTQPKSQPQQAAAPQPSAGPAMSEVYERAASNGGTTGQNESEGPARPRFIPQPGAVYNPGSG